ncbi:hypothetical protein ACFQJD_05460 [Haloplanus sp. GCM10025708]|uniref:hypothetical protein n=1 Tax=Haloferacaceae TaxID=1644056 RepID=UPI00361E1674
MSGSLPFPLSGSTLVTGPAKTGKTRLTAAALDAWVDRHGPEGVAVFEFAPEVYRDGQLFGGSLSRFTTVPADSWQGVLDAHAPRADSEGDEARALELARDNAERAVDLFDAAPADPAAVFVNDATIPFQHPDSSPSRLTGYCDRAEAAVVNAFESDELGTDDPVSRREREVLDAFASWADRRIRLGE